MNLYGQSLKHFDAKNRVVVPGKFRDAIGQDELRGGLVVTVGFERCLFLFTRTLWDEAVTKFAAVHFTSHSARTLHRLFLSDAEDVTPDKTGRILVPDRLREYAGLGDEALFVGVTNRIEIWSPSRWAQLKDAHAGQYEELAEEFHRHLDDRKTP